MYIEAARHARKTNRISSLIKLIAMKLMYYNVLYEKYEWTL